MNRDQTEGKWEQVKGRARLAWAELTDDDVARAEGSSEKLYGIIQEKFGDTKDAIQKKIDSIHM